MSMVELIDQLKKESNNGAFGLIKDWLDELEEYPSIIVDASFYKLEGVLWGVYAVGFITELEREELMQEIINKSIKRYVGA